MWSQTGIGLFTVVMLVCHRTVSSEYVYIQPYVMEQGSRVESCLIVRNHDSIGPDTEYIVDIVLHYHHIERAEDYVYDLMFEGKGDLHKCQQFVAPSAAGRYKLSATAQLQLQNEAGDDVSLLLFEETTQQVHVISPTAINLIQTDKPQYKPGDTVKIRALSIDKKLNVKLDFEKFTVESPGQLLMAQWKADSVSSGSGLFSFQFPISAEPEFGQWTIKGYSVSGGVTTQYFKVEKYVLPKYEITVTNPSYLTLTTKMISGTVCAKYTYGKPVKGTLKLDVCFIIETYSWRGPVEQRPCANIIAKFDGCYEYHIDAATIELGNKKFLTDGLLRLNASVIETATGVELTKSVTGPSISSYPLSLSLQDDSNNYFKPGFPYRGRVLVTNPDGSPAPGEEIEVQVNGFFTSQNDGLKKTFLSNEDGVVHFVITEMLSENQYSVTARAVQYAEETYRPYYSYWYSPSQPTAYASVTRWTSPSNSYLYIPDTDSQVACEDSVTLDVYYTATLGKAYEFTYMVSSLGSMVSVGKQTHTPVNSVDGQFTEVDPDQLLEPYKEPVPEVPEEVYSEPVYEDLITPEVASVSGGRKRREAGSGSTIATFKLPVDLAAYRDQLGSEANLLVFYMREDSEIVSTNIKLSLQNCFKNKASLSFGEAESVRPGSDVTMKVGASPGSFCFVGMVDKSINLLGGYNQLTPDKLFKTVEEFGRPTVWLSFWEEDQAYCDVKLPTTPLPPQGPEPRRYYQYQMPARPTGVDAIQPFRDSWVWVVSDGILETRECERPQYMMRKMYMVEQPNVLAPMAFEDSLEASFDAEPPPSPVPKIRSHFPETWLWDIVQVDDEGAYTGDVTVPDTITEWVGNTLCVHQSDGVGVTDITGLTVFQPFFVSLTLPYSVIRGETVPILVTIFNYLKDCITMEITLEETEGYEAASGATKTSMCVCGGDAGSTKFHIIPKIIGEMELVVTAVSVADNGVCSNVVVSTEAIGVSDGVERQLRVEAEGVMLEVTQSSFLCNKDGSESEFLVDMSLPDDRVPDSERATLAVVGDVMGPTLNNLDNLLRMPYGCGEQNMASWSPNIYVLQYLIGTNQITEGISKKAKLHMQTGYQRQQRYRHRDNSYSAFGEGSNSNGSIWLTAFVVKSMAQSAPFVAIDPYVVKESVRFIQGLQLSDGCYPQYGKVFSSYMKGGLQDEYNKEGLTAFILIALLEARQMEGLEESETWTWGRSIDEAIECLHVDYTSLDTYTLTVTAYALALAQSPNLNDVIIELKSRAKISGGSMFWSRDEVVTDDTPYWYRYSSAEVEMTSYGLMALLQHDPAATAQVVPIVRWLSKQRNPYGGFSSTQDTVVALQALSKFARLTYSGEQGSITVRVSQGGNPFSQYDVNADNRLIYQSAPVKPNKGNITFNVAGTGCVLLQVGLRYNVYEEEDDGPAFEVNVDVYRSQKDKNNCAQRTLHICARYLKGGVSNMAIVKVKAPTGWVPEEQSLQQLQNDGVVSRFDVEEDIVNLYFEQLSKSRDCVEFEMDQIIELNPKAALVTVYDYYETSYSVTESYEIKTTCGTKAEIPDENNGLDCSIVQCRAVATPMTCPRCPVGKLTREELETLTCASHAVYKGFVARSGEYPIKFKADIRNKKKVILDDFVTYTVSKDCNCPILDNSAETRALIFLTDDKVYDKSNSRITLSDAVTFVKYTKNMERDIRVIATKAKFCNKMERRKRAKTLHKNNNKNKIGRRTRQ